MNDRDDESLPILEDPEALVDRLIATAIARGEDNRRRAWIVGAGALAAIGTIAVALGLNLAAGPVRNPAIVMATVGDTHVVRLVYESQAERPNARVSVTLPRNLELLGHTGERDVAWSASLRKGKNLLELPVVLTDLTEAQLEVAFSSGDESKEVRVIVRAASDMLRGAELEPALTDVGAMS